MLSPHLQILEPLKVLWPREPDELDYIKTGVRKYDEAGCAEIEVDTKQE